MFSRPLKIPELLFHLHWPKFLEQHLTKKGFKIIWPAFCGKFAWTWQTPNFRSKDAIARMYRIGRGSQNTLAIQYVSDFSVHASLHYTSVLHLKMLKQIRHCGVQMTPLLYILMHTAGYLVSAACSLPQIQCFVWHHTQELCLFVSMYVSNDISGCVSRSSLARGAVLI